MYKQLVLAAALGGLTAPLGGCGFTPLYATPAVSPALSSIETVLPGTSRTGFLLREQLIHELGRDEDDTPHYRLTLTLSELRVPEGVRVNNVANRYEIDVTATYSLSDAATAKVLYNGSTSAEVSYDSDRPALRGRRRQPGRARSESPSRWRSRSAWPWRATSTARRRRAPEPRAAAMILGKRADADRFLARPGADVRVAVIWGRDRGGVRERANGLAAKVCDNPEDPFDAALLTEADVDADGRAPRRRTLRHFDAGRPAAGAAAPSGGETGGGTGPPPRPSSCTRRGPTTPTPSSWWRPARLERGSALRKAAETAKAGAVSIPVYEDEIGDIARSVREALAVDRLALTPEALDLFVNRLPKERGVVRQEIERLSLYLKPGSGVTAGPAELTDYLGVEPEASLSDAAADAFGGRMALAHAALRRARAEGEGGPAAVRAVSGHLNRLRRARILMEAGASPPRGRQGRRGFLETGARVHPPAEELDAWRPGPPSRRGAGRRSSLQDLRRTRPPDQRTADAEHRGPRPKARAFKA